MRIGIDARLYGTLGKGLGRYVSELIAQLEKVDRTNDYVVFLRRANFDAYVPKNPRFRKVLAEIPWYGWREQLLFPIMLSRQNLDLVHFPHFNVPFLYHRPFVVTIHDLILLSHPTPRATRLAPLTYRLKYLAYRLVIGSALRRAKRIITVSEFSKTEIRKNFPFTVKKDIAVTYEACGTHFLTSPPAGETRLTVPRPFFLYVGNAYPHKNLDRLITAFQKFRDQGHAEHHLVLVGGSDYFYDRLQREARAGNRSENVVFFGQADDGELASLFDAAQAYVFPSLCEGFGLPPLEAMCRNVPVASSSETCLPEILGDAALYFDPRDEVSMTDALTRLATDATLREELKAKGRERSARYDWSRCAAATLDIYNDAAKGRTQAPRT